MVVFRSGANRLNLSRHIGSIWKWVIIFTVAFFLSLTAFAQWDKARADHIHLYVQSTTMMYADGRIQTGNRLWSSYDKCMVSAKIIGKLLRVPKPGQKDKSPTKRFDSLYVTAVVSVCIDVTSLTDALEEEGA